MRNILFILPLFALVLLYSPFVLFHIGAVGVSRTASALLLPLSGFLFVSMGQQSAAFIVYFISLLPIIGIISGAFILKSLSVADQNQGLRKFFIWLLMVVYIVAALYFGAWLFFKVKNVVSPKPAPSYELPVVESKSVPSYNLPVAN